MSDYKHGSMDTSVQEKTFENFGKMVTRSSIAIIIALVFLALVGA
ncbi:MAG: aa3-type cytochrome c oxidase subunit IV [Maritimibacter sp.]